MAGYRLLTQALVPVPVLVCDPSDVCRIICLRTDAYAGGLIRYMDRGHWLDSASTGLRIVRALDQLNLHCAKARHRLEAEQLRNPDAGHEARACFILQFFQVQAGGKQDARSVPVKVHIGGDNLTSALELDTETTAQECR